MSAVLSRLRCGAAAVLLAAVTTIMTAAGLPVTAAAAGGPACPGQSSPHNTPVSAADFAPVNGTVPRPIVLVHGWDSSYTAMAGYAKLLDTSKVLHEPLRAFRFDYSASSGPGRRARRSRRAWPTT